jgi:opacity protein-like surface antigen
VKSASVLGCVFAGSYLCLSAPAAWAQENPLGLYVGAGVGTATVRQEPEPDTGYYGLSREDFGWDAFIGVRPSPYLGAEVGYLDFGSTDHSGYYPAFFVPGHASANAPAAFAVGYLPFQPWWDLYFKAGAARLHKTWDFYPEADCTFSGCTVASASYPGSSTDWDFAWGVGTQWKFGQLALRAEYQRVQVGGSTNPGDPDLLTVGLSWTLF